MKTLLNNVNGKLKCKHILLAIIIPCEFQNETGVWTENRRTNAMNITSSIVLKMFSWTLLNDTSFLCL
jgi:hypothetical protein